MKFRNLFFSFIATMFAVGVLSAQDDDKTLLKTLNPENSNAVVLDFAYTTKAEEWKEPNIRIMMTVKLTNGNDNVLKQLVQVGRYNVEGKKEGDKYIVSIPGLKKDVTVKGVKMEEEVAVTILVPTGITVSNSTGTAIEVESEFMGSLAAKGFATRGEPIFKNGFEVAIQFTSGTTDASVVSPDDILVGGEKLSSIKH